MVVAKMDAADITSQINSWHQSCF